MSFQLTFLGYYSIKSPQLKKQTHSVKRRNWSHRERTAQADGPGWTAEADGFRWTAIADGPRRTGQPSASVGRPWKTAPAAGGRPRRQLADGCQGGRPWDRRTRPDVRRTRPWTSGRVTTLPVRDQLSDFQAQWQNLGPHAQKLCISRQDCQRHISSHFRQY
jgi:hypothetical protein